MPSEKIKFQNLTKVKLLIFWDRNLAGLYCMEFADNNLMSKIELSFAEVRYKKPIVYFLYKGDMELGFPEIRELVKAAELLSNHRPYVTLSDVRAGVRITKEGQRYVADLSNMPHFRGTAVLVRSSMLKFAMNVLKEFLRKDYPYKIFTDEQKAEAWLMQVPLEP